ncbi:hypothetical protein OP10G_1101 [Fimbriimonas ginsengisoli Gsoil 348]|uniref:Uncharacterized protein n=1 Tax=Fimbriimonas ginsengisoli Gsoil 348 TaxID=661478 RepID=A0A068NS85_FIMGI|nr:hypothetical protein OP10G_1101 [Fimbriimonas ginsengisoli Gsoil 348]
MHRRECYATRDQVSSGDTFGDGWMTHRSIPESILATMSKALRMRQMLSRHRKPE